MIREESINLFSKHEYVCFRCTLYVSKALFLAAAEFSIGGSCITPRATKRSNENSAMQVLKHALKRTELKHPCSLIALMLAPFEKVAYER